VALSIHADLEKQIHIGHLRTILLGQLIANDLNVPYHIRCDASGRHAGDNVSGGAIDLASCLNWLGIEAATIYWAPHAMPSLERVQRVLGYERGAAYLQTASQPGFGSLTPGAYAATISDDVIDWFPSLMIRGTDFIRPEIHGGPAPDGANGHKRNEEILFEAACRKRHELNVPCILGPDGSKISKRSALIPHWEMLTMLGRAKARALLIASALCPSDPMSVWGRPWSRGMMSMEDAPLTWETIAEAVKAEEPTCP
jgi:hypothetical protein